VAAAAMLAGSVLTKAFAKGKIMPQEVDAIEPNAVPGVPGSNLGQKLQILLVQENWAGH